MIHFDRVSFTYPDASEPVLSELSFEIGAGEFVLVAGRSGSGKSTLLRCINGLVPHFSGGRFGGRVLVNGLDTRRTAPGELALHAGFVFQEPEAQFVTERVEDELAFGMENMGVPRHTMRKRMEEVLDLLGIAALRRRAIDSLSGGEQQRVAIAAALALQPPALALDEPTSQLDPLAAEEVLAALARLNADLGLTIVLSEHRLERVAQHADRMIHMQGPTQPIIGSPREVLAQIDLAPPVTQLGKALHWEPLPLTVKEGRRFSIADRRSAKRRSAGRQSEIANQPSPILELDHVSYAYGDHTALRNVSLQVQAGEFVALMGRNGSGKTTLLKCAVGLLKPRAGVVRVQGADIRNKRVDEVAQRVGYAPQDPGALLFADTVIDELRFTLKNHHIENGQAASMELLAALGLDRLAQSYPRDLSTGERERVALASIFVARPALLLLDEPTRGLDYASKERLRATLKQWQQEGKAIVVVTHDVEWVACAADRVLLMAEGEIVVDAPVREALSESAIFSTQINKLFAGTQMLTVDDVIENVELRM
jgi:energy-coupling factor transport system ATP-binding protein